MQCCIWTPIVPHNYAFTNTVMTLREKTHLAPVKFQVPSSAAFQSQHSLEGESSLNYKSRGFKRLCRLPRSRIWCPQLFITCLHQSGPCIFFSPLCLQTNTRWHIIRSCEGVRRAPDEPGVRTDIARKGQLCRATFS